MLRLAPSHPPLWRTPSSLQLGAEGRIRIDEVTGWQEQLIEALRDGIPDAMLLPLARSLGAPSGLAQRFVDDIRAALVPGPTPLLRVQAEMPSDLGYDESDALAHGMRAGDLDAVTVARWPIASPDPSLPMILVADRVVEPRRAAALMSVDAPHIPLVLSGDRVAVGPVVRPGVTACLSCLHEHRIDADPTWPMVAAQLIGRAPQRTDPALVLEAAVLAGRMLRAALADGRAADAVPNRSVTLSSGDLRRVWHAHRPHARCLCRSPEGIATSAGVVMPSAPPTTATATARRA